MKWVPVALLTGLLFFSLGTVAWKKGNSGGGTECVMLDAAGINCSSSGGCSITDEAGDSFDYTTADFDSTSDESGTWTFGLPDNLTGTTFTAQVFWTSNDADCNADGDDDVCWTVAAEGLADGGDWDGASLGTSQGREDLCAGVGFLNVSTVTDVITHTWVANERAIVRILRDVDAGHADCSADGLGADARILHVKVCYGVDNVFSGE